MSTYTESETWVRPKGLAQGRYETDGFLEWELGRKGSDLWVIVPKGFVFDVSIPCGLRWLFDPHDHRFLKAAAIHDWLLRLGWDRTTAAAVFHEALKADGVSKRTRLVMFLAVFLWKFY